MYVGFECHKCEHRLYIDVDDFDVETFDRISNMDCPYCGEEGYENWIALGIVDIDMGNDGELDDEDDYEG